MEKINGKGLNLKEEYLNKIKSLFPECITDGKIDFQVFKKILSDDIDDSNERYSFNWGGKTQSLKNSLTPSVSTLRPLKNKSLNWDKTKNIYIEGDNLEVLKTLSKTYYNSIKMIYIDPPYNTGNDFVYNDNFIDDKNNYTDFTMQRLKSNPETAGRYHTDWLNMMYPRLRIARDLLCDDGFIFISIDENELFNLKKICDELFGDYNFRSSIVVQANPGGRDYGGIAKTTEYILVYSKSPYSLISKVEDENHIFEMKDEIGPFELRELRNRNTVFNDKNRPNLCYPFYVDPNDSDEFGLLNVSLEEDEKHNVKVMPLVSQGIQTVWRWGKEEKSRPNLNINVKAKRKQDGTYMIVEKYRDEKVMVKNIWLDKKFRTENGSVEFRDLFGQKGIFSYPKPVEIPSLLCDMCTSDDDIVLDFFSGSATTAHAVLESNMKNHKNLKFILVQLPEICDDNSEAKKAGYNTICDIGEDRIRKACDKLSKEFIEEHSNHNLFETNESIDDFDMGFKVFKLDSSNIKTWDNTSKQDSNSVLLLEDVIKEDRTNLDVAYEVMLKYGVFNMPLEEIMLNGKTVYSIGSNYMIISLNNEITADDVLAIAKLEPKVVVFKESGFADDNAKINADYTFKRLGVDKVMCI